MSDDEHDVETFESADAGASHTVPMQAGSVRKGGFMVRATTRDARCDRATRSRDGGGNDARGETRTRATRTGSMGKKCARARNARAGEGRAREGEGRREDVATWGLSRGNPVPRGRARSGRRERGRDGGRLTVRGARF
jgi:hypothetical protein